ncbi:nonribosomal peptide synthase Pes1 [Apiospora rasikravindrae]|uniref:Nonribosomal peptide synthase Pes1 n=1 Tax=Apiospora rasikravindrae TaxID=990691 RepID=A0ABR1S0P5_9PEZI
MTFGALIKQIQDQATAGIPHQHVGFRSIVRQCTDWPPWTRLGSVIVYQNHEAVGDSLSFGHVDATITGEGTTGDSTDFWVIAKPGLGEQARWVSRCLESVLTSVHTLLEQPLESFQELVDGPVPVHIPAAIKTVDSPTTVATLGSPDRQAMAIVALAWSEVDLKGDNGEEVGEEVSLFDCGGDLETVLLLSWWYRYRGHGVSMYDIIENPTRLGQSQLLGKGVVRG